MIILANDSVVVLRPIGLILKQSLQREVNYFRTITFARMTVLFVSAMQRYLLQTLY